MKNKLLLSFAILLFSSLLANAGGSVHRDDIQELLKTNPVVAKLIKKNVVLNEVGGAVRLGRHMGDLGGARIGPYEFPAKVIDAKGVELMVILHTEVIVTDAKGKSVDLDEVTPQSSGHKISEKLLSVEFQTKPK